MTASGPRGEDAISVAAARQSASGRAAPEEPVLPEQTSDDTDSAWGEPADRAWDRDSDDERFLRERPPHWE